MAWQGLVVETKKLCLSFLQPVDLASAALVSKEFNELASNEDIWKRHYVE